MCHCHISFDNFVGLIIGKFFYKIDCSVGGGGRVVRCKTVFFVVSGI